VGAADAADARGVLQERPRLALIPYRAQLLAGPPARSPEAVCERLLAVQAQDPRGFRLAVRARTSGLTVAGVDAALASGALVVSWLNRGTLHLVRAEDYWLLHPLTTPRLATGNAARLRQEGVSPRDAERGVAAVVSALSDGPLGRTALRAAVGAAGVPVAGQALVHVLVLATLRGLVVRGPMVGREHGFVLVSSWLGPPVLWDRDEALRELGRRYVVAHGPATDRDLAKWAGIRLTDARRALDGVRQPRAVRDVPPPRLLGAFDEVLMGWESRAPVLGAYESRVVSGGLFRPFALVDGVAAGLWRIERQRVVVEPFGDLDVSRLDAEARDVERFLDVRA
jgi:hypothetical protein